MSDGSPMRRHPKQARSQQRVGHLLRVAAQTFEEMGYAAGSTNIIAARAGVAIGSLYQFFPNKEAILDALIERYLEDMRREVFVRDVDLPITRWIELLVDRLARFLQLHTGFRAVFLDANVARRVHSALIQQSEADLERYFPALNAALRLRIASTWLGITRGIMQLVAPAQDLSDSVTQSEVKLALLSYLRAILERAGLPLPEDLQETTGTTEKVAWANPAG